MKRVIFAIVMLVSVAMHLPSATAGDTPPKTEDEVHAALKAANPQYARNAKFYQNREDGIWGVDVSGCAVTTLEPLRGMDISAVACSNTGVTDLSPLKGMKLKQFTCSNTPVSDLRPLAGMPIFRLEIDETKVTDLSPLEGLSLQTLAFNPERITKGIEVLRTMDSLIMIMTEADKDAGKGLHLRTGLQPKTFWEKYDSGEFGSKK